MNSLRYYTEKLIRIPSVTGDEKQIADYVEAELERIGLKPKRVANNLVAGSGELMLVGHLDTVPFSGTSTTKPRFSKGKLYGRGSCDMKAGLAVMLELAKSEEVKLAFYSGEEGAAPNGLNQLKQRGLLKAKAAIALEPTGLNLYTGCRGRLLFSIDSIGRASHSSMPELGQNAIYLSQPMVQRIRSAEPRLKKLGETMAVTMISGGSAPNIIPADCRIFVDYRFSPSKSLSQARDAARAVAGKKVSFIDRSHSYQLNPVLEKYFEQLGRPRIFPAWSDAAQLFTWGIPCAIFGPGNVEEAHSQNEFVSIAQLERAYVSLRRLARNFSTSLAVS